MRIIQKKYWPSYLLGACFGILSSSDVTAFSVQPVNPTTRTIHHDTSLMQIKEDNVLEPEGRRDFLSNAAVASLAFVATSTSSPQVSLAAGSSGPAVNYRDIADDIESLVRKDYSKGPTLVRLAWHSSGTYDKISKTGGSSGGTIRFKEELEHGANAGLAITAISWLDPIKEKYGDALSYADLYTLGGVVAIKTMGGPRIPWRYGRVDALDPSAVTPNGRLPSADSGPPGADRSDAAHLRAIFNRMGFNDREIVALSGAHALGRCHTEFSGYDGPWTFAETSFSNLYFLLLRRIPWAEREWDGPLQYESRREKLMMLPTDLVLIQDDKFNRYVRLYSRSKRAFFRDFSRAFQKLEELGTKDLKSVRWG